MPAQEQKPWSPIRELLRLLNVRVDVAKHVKWDTRLYALLLRRICENIHVHPCAEVLIHVGTPIDVMRSLHMRSLMFLLVLQSIFGHSSLDLAHNTQLLLGAWSPMLVI